jgi:hypothetical protein
MDIPEVSCVPCVANFFGLSILIAPLVFSNVYLLQMLIAPLECPFLIAFLVFAKAILLLFKQ